MRIQNKRNLFILLVISLAFLVFSLNNVVAAPYGAGTVDEKNSTSAVPDAPQDHEALAGNVTEITITGFSTTRSWQGYYGNVTGVIQLADSADNVMYNWSEANPRGEVYASRNGTINWNYVQCLNYTANGTYCADDTNRAGATSLCGMNYTQLHTNYNISSDDVDAVNNTFTLNNHALFYTGSLNFSLGECKNMKVYNSTGVGAFDEALLYEPTGRSVIFTSILQRDANGFDSKTHDFEMLVLEDGHATDIITTTYYFYIELGA